MSLSPAAGGRKLLAMQTKITALPTPDGPIACKGVLRDAAPCPENAAWLLTGDTWSFELCWNCVKRVTIELEHGHLLPQLLAGRIPAPELRSRPPSPKKAVHDRPKPPGRRKRH